MSALLALWFPLCISCQSSRDKTREPWRVKRADGRHGARVLQDSGMAIESSASQRRNASPRTVPRTQSPLPKCLEPLSVRSTLNGKGNEGTQPSPSTYGDRVLAKLLLSLQPTEKKHPAVVQRTLRATWPLSKVLPHHLALWLSASALTFLCLSFLTCKLLINMLHTIVWRIK